MRRREYQVGACGARACDATSTLAWGLNDFFTNLSHTPFPEQAMGVPGQVVTENGSGAPPDNGMYPQSLINPVPPRPSEGRKLVAHLHKPVVVLHMPRLLQE